MNTIYLICDIPGEEGEAETNNRAMADALIQKANFRECTKDEWEAMKTTIERLDIEASES